MSTQPGSALAPHILASIAAAPPFTAEQVERLSALLRPAAGGGHVG